MDNEVSQETQNLVYLQNHNDPHRGEITRQQNTLYEDKGCYVSAGNNAKVTKSVNDKRCTVEQSANKTQLELRIENTLSGMMSKLEFRLGNLDFLYI